MPKNRQAGIHLHKTLVSGQWYWILIAKNGKTIAKSSETYKTKRSAVKSIRIAGREFAEATGVLGYQYYDHSNGSVFPNYIVF